MHNPDQMHTRLRWFWPWALVVLLVSVSLLAHVSAAIARPSPTERAQLGWATTPEAADRADAQGCRAHARNAIYTILRQYRLKRREHSGAWPLGSLHDILCRDTIDSTHSAMPCA
jgi:hypothetical protein